MDLFTIRHGAASDKGLKREQNEDCFGIDAERRLYVVCDGISAHRAGDIASKRAVAAIRHHIAEARWLYGDEGGRGETGLSQRQAGEWKANLAEGDEIDVAGVRLHFSLRRTQS